MDEPRIIELDARTLRAMAHPLRLRMLGLLRVEGPATATSLAARLGESSGTTSWHLRQLAEHGLIEEDPERGNRRERWWRAVHRYTRIPYAKFVDDPENTGAVSTFLHESMSIYYRKATTFIADLPSWSRDWLEAAIFSDDEMPLTPDELRAMRADLLEVKRRYLRDPRPGDEPVVFQLQVFPRRHP